VWQTHWEPLDENLNFSRIEWAKQFNCSSRFATQNGSSPRRSCCFWTNGTCLWTSCEFFRWKPIFQSIQVSSEFISRRDLWRVDGFSPAHARKNPFTQDRWTTLKPPARSSRPSLSDRTGTPNGWSTCTGRARRTRAACSLFSAPASPSSSKRPSSRAALCDFGDFSAKILRDDYRSVSWWYQLLRMYYNARIISYSFLSSLEVQNMITSKFK